MINDEKEYQLPLRNMNVVEASSLKRRQLSTETQSTADISYGVQSWASFEDEEPSSSIHERHHLSSSDATMTMDVEPSTSSNDSENSIYMNYEICSNEIIGEGRYGIVRRCIHRLSGAEYAVKSIYKDLMCSEQQRVLVQREVEIMCSLPPNKGLIQLVDFYEDNQFYHLVTELCKGGELYDMILQKQLSSSSTDTSSSPLQLFSEEQTSCILRSILESVACLHSQNIVHRDIKPENILLSGNQLKLIDFGMAVRHDSNQDRNLEDMAGTSYYMAPEVLKKSYGKSCDIWSIGVVAYILLVGHPPFEGETDTEVMSNIRKGRLNVDAASSQMTTDAQDFLKQVLKRDPRRRITVEQALKHPWITREKYVNTYCLNLQHCKQIRSQRHTQK